MDEQLSWLQAIVLGISQGLTEFLPISSTAHTLIVSKLLGWPDPGAAFTAVTQVGTELAVVIYFRQDIARILKAGKAPGVLATDEALARHYLACGARFVAVGLDAQLLTRSSRDLAARFKSAAAPATRQGGSY